MWRKVKRALGLNLCVYVPRTTDDDDGGAGSGGYSRLSASTAGGRVSDAAVAATSSPVGSLGASDLGVLLSTTPTPTSGGLKLSKSGSRSSKKTCAICLGSMKLGHGHALFTAECSHAFHFNCIASNVKHGNYICPVCRAKWKEIPFQAPVTTEHPLGRSRINPVNWSQEDGQMTFVHRLPRADSSNRQHTQLNSYMHASEPSTFNDDEPIELLSEATMDFHQGFAETVEIKTYPEFLAIPQSASYENFAVLIHLKAPHASMMQMPGRNLNASSSISQNSRAPIDLVTVLDVSGSMAGTKLALLKRAMGFVIQNLGSSDRLSVISFSSTARRLFPLRRMSDSGRQQALQAVNSLVSSGGTNIAEGLRKGAKVVEERREKNPVCSIILLSDGQDTYTISSVGSRVQRSPSNYKALVPHSILGGTTHQIPVHAFGFGADHDSAAMHTISEISSGTFSFIESEVVIQDAFAQCIGGLLSVVVQDVQIFVECAHPGVQLASINSGSYTNQVAENRRTGLINIGDLYADEERDFLVSVDVPPAREEITLLKVGCAYRDLVSKEYVTLEDEVRIQRPTVVMSQTMSIEVDRERNRIQAAEAMSDARAAAERGDLAEAVSILERRRRILSESLAGQSGDHLCLALDAELKEMQERMANRRRYEMSGRAYVLSGLSSHSWQRATARGNSTDSSSLVHAYQTPSMVDMLQRSQTLYPSPRDPTLPVRPSRSSPIQPRQR